MGGSVLTQLPVEVLRQIVTCLPPRSALALTSTCRRIHAACDDWAVWREVLAAQHTPNYLNPLVLARYNNERTIWKRYVVADFRASQVGPGSVEDVRKWLPHIIALHHPVFEAVDAMAIHQLCDPICDFPLVCTALVNEDGPPNFPARPTSPFDADAWRLAQAGGFCLAAQLLSSSTSTAAEDEEPPQMLRSAQWFRLHNYLGNEVGDGDSSKCVIMLHALANRAVGFFYRELCWALANHGTVSGSTAGITQPPTTFTIPFPSLLAPPVPFMPGSLEQFSRCHLASMTEPSFFTDDEWTGYISLKNGLQNGPRMRFDAIGGDNPDVSYNRWDEIPNNTFPFRVERTIRFQLIQEWDNSNKYLLHSNCFHSQASMHMLRLTVDRATGCIAIAHHHPLRTDWAVLNAVMTPFGIMEGNIPNGFWTWLWKCNWSPSCM